MVQHETSTSAPKSPQELLARYLERLTATHMAGFGHVADEGEVEPYDAIPARPVDARVAWAEAAAAAHVGRPGKAPADWPALVAAHEPVTALAFALGNFPQLVRDLHPLWQADNLASTRPSGDARPLPAPSVREWAARATDPGTKLLAAGVLRLARQFEQAEALLNECRQSLPAEWQATWANEWAALEWHRGRADAALAAWRSQPESVTVLFNRGMAALFTGHTAEARTALDRAAKQLPEDNPWHHLARLYLSLAEARS
jgi:tetratricopeptide (TPR) repeat protein